MFISKISKMNKEWFGKYSRELEKYASRSKDQTMGWICVFIGAAAVVFGEFMPFTGQNPVMVIPYLGTMLSSTFTVGLGIICMLGGLLNVRLQCLPAKG